MLRAFFDDSGKSADPGELAIGIAGAIGGDDQWADFRARWDESLTHFGVSACHATDLNALQGVFSGWQPHQRHEFASALVNSVTASGVVPIAAVVPLHSFLLLPPEYQDAALDAFYLCWQVCLGNVALHATGYPYEERVEVTIAQTPKMTGRALELYEVVRSTHPLGWRLMEKCKVGTPATSLEVQAADLIAYTLTKYMKTFTANGGWAVTTHLAFAEIPEAMFDFLPFDRLMEGFADPPPFFDQQDG